MGLYEPLKQALVRNGFSELPMTFQEVEKVIGRPLPASAYKHRPWWANEAKGHSHAQAWLEAGYETSQVDMSARKLVFRRIMGAMTPANRPATGMSDWAREFRQKETVGRASLFGALKGTFSITGDLTEPTLNADDLKALDANIDRTADLIDAGLRPR